MEQGASASELSRKLIGNRMNDEHSAPLPKESNFKEHFEMNQTNLEKQTEDLAELLERDVADINRMDVVHSFQMAKKRRGASQRALGQALIR